MISRVIDIDCYQYFSLLCLNFGWGPGVFKRYAAHLLICGYGLYVEFETITP